MSYTHLAAQPRLSEKVLIFSIILFAFSTSFHDISTPKLTMKMRLMMISIATIIIIINSSNIIIVILLSSFSWPSIIIIILYQHGEEYPLCSVREITAPERWISNKPSLSTTCYFLHFIDLWKIKEKKLNRNTKNKKQEMSILGKVIKEE